MKTFTTKFAGLSRSGGNAFTLIELLVTISIIALVLGIAGPTTIRLFSTSADTQAYTIFSTQMALARAGAIESANFVGLHCQIATSKSSKDFVASQRLSDKCMTAIVEYDTDSASASYQKFILKNGETPQEVPGNMAFGQLDATYIDSSLNQYKTNVGSDMTGFTTFTILFNGDGELTCNVNGDNIIFYASSPLFLAGGTDIWNYDATGVNGINGSSGEPGVYAVTMFDYLTLKNKSDDSAKRTYLNESGQFLVTNVYTGRLFNRE